MTILLVRGVPMFAMEQSFEIKNEVVQHNTLSGTAVKLSGKSELHLSNSASAISDSTVELQSLDAWLFFDSIKPSEVTDTYLDQARVDGAAAKPGINCRVVQYGNGTVMIPHRPDYAALTIYDMPRFQGEAMALQCYSAYNNKTLGRHHDKIRSFKLKRGYMATIAENKDGTGVSRNYVASDGDLEVSLLPPGLDQAASFVRIFPWRWVTKKGSCDIGPKDLNASWFYNWNIASESSLDYEYVAIKQQRWWPGLDQDWRQRGINHVSGFNEPNNHVEDAFKSLDGGKTSNAVDAWPDLLRTGLRVGAPAVTDGGYGWLADFMKKAEKAGHRIDYVPVHYYRSFWQKGNAEGAANQLYHFLKSIHDLTGRPVWLTEFNNGANWTDNNHDPDVNQNRNTVEAMVKMMDRTPWIERYSVYSRVEWFRETHYKDGKLTPMGQMYKYHVAPMAYRQLIPDAGYGANAGYAFNGNYEDLLKNANRPMAVGTPSFVPGKFGESLTLDGTHDYLQLPAGIGDCEDFTFAAWVKWNGGEDMQRIFDFGDDGENGGSQGRYMFLTPNDGKGIRFSITTAGYNNDQILSYDQALPTDTWVHLAVTIYGDTGKLFVNGQLVDSNRQMSVHPLELNTQYNYIGKSRFPGDPLFNGQLDNVEILSKALTDFEIKDRAK